MKANILMFGSLFVAAAGAGMLLFGLAPAQGQAPAIPRMSNGQPDFNGVWDHPRVEDVTKSKTGCGNGTPGCKQEGAGELSYTAEGLARWKDTSRYDFTARCLPYGYLRGWNSSAPIEILQSSDRLAVFFEIGSDFHIIPTDGRTHPKDQEANWGGNSVGRFEGDTLVVDTIGFNEKTYIDTVEHPHSEQLHVIERIKYVDPQHISHELTFEDPKIYEKPFKNSRVMSRMKPGQELMEYVCMENNKELLEGHLVGH